MRTITIAIAACAVALTMPAAPAVASKRPTRSQARAITHAVEASRVGGVNKLPRNRYTVANIKVSTVSRSWAYAEIKPRKAFEDTLQGGHAFLVRLSGTPAWVVVDVGTAQVGCGILPTEVITDLLGHAADCESAQDQTAFVQTAQSAPATVTGGSVSSVVGQAAITKAGRLIVRLAAPNSAGVAGEDVLARTSTKIPDAVSDPTKSGLQIALKPDGTGIVSVIGPKNKTQPDSVVFSLAWSAGTQPSIRITGAGV
jgi:hypothetical protein